jgi:hypothetical protein
VECVTVSASFMDAAMLNSNEDVVWARRLVSTYCREDEGEFKRGSSMCSNSAV